MSTLLQITEAIAEPAAHGAFHAGDGPPFPFFVFPLIWLVLLGTIVLVVLLGRRRRDRAAGAVAGERVLAERYAAGEIAESEYRDRRAVLRQKR